MAPLKYLSRTFLPFLQWLPDASKPEAFRGDLAAGLTTAMVVIPQSMANAQLAGLPPYMGLYASFLPAIIAAFFGSSRQLSSGPVAIVSLLTATSLGPLVMRDPDASFVAYAVALALIVGLFQLALGLLRLGAIVNFLSQPVVHAFTNAGAIIIAVSQLDNLLGVKLGNTGGHLPETIGALVAAFPDTHWPSLGIGLLAAAVILSIKRFMKKLPGILIAVVMCTLLSWLLNLEDLGVRVIGEIPAGLPSMSLPSVNLSVFLQMLGVGAAISVVGFMEAISIAKSMAAQTRQRLDVNQELVGQGLANMAASVTSGYPVSGSFARSAVNFSAGAKTAMASAYAGLCVALVLVAFTPALYHLPISVLAAVVITAVSNLVHIEPFVNAWKVQREDAIVGLLTFVAILLFAPHLEYGIIAGVVLALLLYLARTMRPQVFELSRHADGTLRPVELFDLPICPKVCMLRFDGSLYFANVDAFESFVLDKVASHPDVDFVVLDAEGINEIDSTGVHRLIQIKERLESAGIELLFTNAKLQLIGPLRRIGFIDDKNPHNVFRIRGQAMNYAWSKIDHCPKEGCTQTCPLRRQDRKPAQSTSA